MQNLDCDITCSNIFEELANLLSKSAFPVNSPLSTMHILALDGLIAVIQGMAERISNGSFDPEPSPVKLADFSPPGESQKSKEYSRHFQKEGEEEMTEEDFITDSLMESGPTIAAISVVFDHAENEDVYQTCIDGFLAIAKISACHHLEDVLDDLLGLLPPPVLQRCSQMILEMFLILHKGKALTPLSPPHAIQWYPRRSSDHGLQAMSL
ncbi:hypothetical protein Leryth_011799 [Lithospermum erythrorhizon]|nr:hypothetical protein Leryth_011799 [Lithospermum erythrorhizon]